MRIQYYTFLCFLLISSFTTNLPVSGFLGFQKEETALEAKAIRKDLRNSFLSYIPLVLNLLFHNLWDPVKILATPTSFRILYIIGPPISNVLAGILVRGLSKKRSKFVQNILFTLVGASWVALITLMTITGFQGNIFVPFMKGIIAYGLGSTLIALLNLGDEDR